MRMERKHLALVVAAVALVLASFGGKFWGQSSVHVSGGSSPAAQES
jgi:hypothetical protein